MRVSLCTKNLSHMCSRFPRPQEKLWTFLAFWYLIVRRFSWRCTFELPMRCRSMGNQFHNWTPNVSYVCHLLMTNEVNLVSFENGSHTSSISHFFRTPPLSYQSFRVKSDYQTTSWIINFSFVLVATQCLELPFT